jgi:hypothetical protein
VVWLASATVEDLEEELGVSNNAPTTVFPLGTTTITFTATDACGLTGTATAQVTIQEEAGNIAPVVTVPNSLTITAELCADSVPATDQVIDDWLGYATAKDPDAENGTLDVSNDAPADFPAAMDPGVTTTVEFSATDGDLTTTVPSMLTVIDPNTAPVVTAPTPEPLIIMVPAGTISVPAADPTISAWLASATAYDDDDEESLGVSNDVPTDFDFTVGSTLVTFTATDTCNVKVSATATVTIMVKTIEEPVCEDGSVLVITEMEYDEGRKKLHIEGGEKLDIKGRAITGETITIINADTKEILKEGIKVRKGRWKAKIRGVGPNLANITITTSNGCTVDMAVEDHDDH